MEQFIPDLVTCEFMQGKMMRKIKGRPFTKKSRAMAPLNTFPVIGSPRLIED